MPVEFVFWDRSLQNRRYKLFLDFDFYKPPLNIFKPEEALEVVKMECERLRRLFPKIGRYTLMRSLGGAMALFDGELTQEELFNVLAQSYFVDRGFRHYAFEKGGIQCLRMSPKVVVGGKRVVEPAPWEV
ncbi:MAG: hypothetical protein QW687_01590 [Candidatus Hadarchaeales archaeon]